MDRIVGRHRAVRISGLRKCSDHRDSWHAAEQIGVIGFVAARRSSAWRLDTELFNRAGSYRSGQTGQTVNLMAYAFAGSNPALPSAINKQMMSDQMASVECGMNTIRHSSFERSSLNVRV